MVDNKIIINKHYTVLVTSDTYKNMLLVLGVILLLPTVSVCYCYQIIQI